MAIKHYHFDHVGSYLRTDRLKKARADFAAGKITAVDLKAVQEAEIKALVDKEAEIGLQAVTDGEFNRSWWHLDFMAGLTGVESYEQEASTYQFHGQQTRATNVRLTGKVAVNSVHPFFADFLYLKSITPEGIEAKVTIPSPTMFLRDGRSDAYSDFYESWRDYLDALATAYHDSLLKFYELGARYIQLDDTTWAFLIARLTTEEDKSPYEKQAEDAVYLINKVLEDLPTDLRVTTHICRGNFKSTYLFEGSYAPVAKYLGQLNYDSFFLEYDDARSGDFGPLAEIWNGRKDVLIVLGVFTSKFAALEPERAILSRLHEAAALVPLENLALSTQCGFASTEEGNDLSEEEEWAKLAHIKKMVDQIWK
ncbi:vitamin B12 independent methionine synthase [Lactococcus termiticola]|uniref:5-methyltetrahydropteroyltriglutamate--homocysteine methyltransferase n=1 Tax=Lactococcus termiticola TaxID=2169526 RepID=A0A2R5HED2_9LACT|nr:vitamin B12 independent methionine synthase [Lactococcus termiticola]GBG96433.1 5-methyltetrahydropteroyltriglutamate--homocysteine methyltransferase [Lactococcus termiticola]